MTAQSLDETKAPAPYWTRARVGMTIALLIFLVAAGICVWFVPRVWFMTENQLYSTIVGEMHDDAFALEAAREVRRRAVFPRDMMKVLETIRVVRTRGAKLELISALQEYSGQEDFNPLELAELYWQNQKETPPGYAATKVAIYGPIAEMGRNQEYGAVLAEHFKDDPPSTIRLDEIVWGGVYPSGMLPMRDPALLPASEANYLEPEDIVFGLEVNGEARAYPQGTLEYPELLSETIGGEPITFVFCPLCMTAVAYRSTAGGTVHRFGTSGFLHRSNKLMYDEETNSLWYTMTGEPVVGQLVGKGLKLEALPVVVTTWGEWVKRHPETKTLPKPPDNPQSDFKLPLNRHLAGSNYGDYFASPRLMFQVQARDARLELKQEVFIVRVPETDKEPVAVSQALLTDNPVFHLDAGGRPVVVITHASGANRAYESRGRKFRPGKAPEEVLDAEGRPWRVEEGHLTDGRTKLARLPGHRSYWFAWFAAHPDTKLLK
jgi:hypothetical protein